MIAALKERVKLLLAHILHLVERPAMTADPQKAQRFEALYETTPRGGTIRYNLPDPKYEFLRHLVEHHGVILHGSNRPDLVRLEPRQQTTFLGRSTNAVFATPDDIWSIFFAIVNSHGFVGSKRNNCLRVTDTHRSLRKFYWFSLSQPMLERADLLCGGFIYILPSETFTPGDTPDEWTSTTAVEPLALLPVSPEDFPFRCAITGHLDTEPLWRFFIRMVRRQLPRKA